MSNCISDRVSSLPLEEVLDFVAKEILSVSTLKTQNSDDLDFHDISVWAIKDALRVAFIAGQKSNTGMKELLVKTILKREGIFEIMPSDKYKKGGAAWCRERNKGYARDNYLAMDNKELLELYSSRIHEEGFTEGGGYDDYY